MALKSGMTLGFLLLLVFLGACSTVPEMTKHERFPAAAAADEQIIFSSALKVRAHSLEFDILQGAKGTEVGVFLCDKEQHGILLVKNGDLDLDKLRRQKKIDHKNFYTFENRRECSKFQEAIGFIDSGAPLIINLDRERKRVLTFFY